ncbi:MAG: pyruvate-formate lyase-activating enzyme [Promethearchaeota archaeon CR_4]|nr:MAG: pyruvate-formate lyase-activating enzyme [Candidatus Lokiarchaeota archaeon CR_4]
MMRIAGIVSTSTVDVPGVPVSVLFTVGCNFSCPFCHNFEICHPTAGNEVPLDEITEKLSRNILVEGVNITGGEPTLQPQLVELVKKIRARGIRYIGVDTNGSKPDIIQQLIGLVDRIAMDFKVPWEDYQRVSSSREDQEAVRNTLAFLSQNFKGNFEVRTTVVRQYHTTENLNSMARSLQQLEFRGLWVLQEYQFSKGVNPKMKGLLYSWTRDEIYSIGHDLVKNNDLRIALRTASCGFEKL